MEILADVPLDLDVKSYHQHSPSLGKVCWMYFHPNLPYVLIVSENESRAIITKMDLVENRVIFQEAFTNICKTIDNYRELNTIGIIRKDDLDHSKSMSAEKPSLTASLASASMNSSFVVNAKQLSDLELVRLSFTDLHYLFLDRHSNTSVVNTFFATQGRDSTFRR